MNERERLTALIQKSVDGCARNWAEKIADHLLENGVIVLPCRLHTHIFVVPTVENSLTGITEMVVLGFSIGEPYNTANCFRVRGTSALFSPAFEQFGKTVFLTKEEAEKHLKGGATNE